MGRNHRCPMGAQLPSPPLPADPSTQQGPPASALTPDTPPLLSDLWGDPHTLTHTFTHAHLRVLTHAHSDMHTH